MEMKLHQLTSLAKAQKAYRIAGNFRGKKFLRISQIFKHLQKFFYQILQLVLVIIKGHRARTGIARGMCPTTLPPLTTAAA